MTDMSDMSENLHCAELSPAERGRLIKEWMERTGASEVSGDIRQKLSNRGRAGEGRPEGGVAKVARDLNLPRSTVRDALKAASEPMPVAPRPSVPVPSPREPQNDVEVMNKQETKRAA
jgi:hypothetical protein